jgi:hypothetical protein
MINAKICQMYLYYSSLLHSLPVLQCVNEDESFDVHVKRPIDASHEGRKYCGSRYRPTCTVPCLPG